MPSPTRTLSAFTLVEIMVVVVIIGVLAALGIPAFKRVQRVTINNRVANDLRVFSQAFEAYALEKGTWPANAGNGAVPSGMGSRLKKSVWTAPTSLGGSWNWDFNNVPGYTAGISIQGVTFDAAQMAEIDAKIDDGDLAKGNFRQISATHYVWVLEP